MRELPWKPGLVPPELRGEMSDPLYRRDSCPSFTREAVPSAAATAELEVTARKPAGRCPCDPSALPYVTVNNGLFLLFTRRIPDKKVACDSPSPAQPNASQVKAPFGLTFDCRHTGQCPSGQGTLFGDLLQMQSETLFCSVLFLERVAMFMKERRRGGGGGGVITSE